MAFIMVFSALMLAFGIYAVTSRSILRSAIGLAFCSASLATVFYSLDAQLVSMFELSVCSGLVTLIFIASISLSHSPKMELHSEYNDKARNKGLPALLFVGGAVMLIAAAYMGGEGPELAGPDSRDVSEIFWNARQTDVWGQMAAILCGGVAVTVLFREEKRGK